jgi:hypothetical protein
MTDQTVQFKNAVRDDGIVRVRNRRRAIKCDRVGISRSRTLPDAVQLVQQP